MPRAPVANRLVIGLLAVLLAACPTPARADDASKNHAQQLYERGQLEFELGHFLDAARSFEEAYAEEHRPRLLWNAAQAYRRQFVLDGEPAHLRRAIALYQNYGELITEEAEKEEAHQALETVREQLAAFEKGRGATPQPPPSTAPATPAPAPEPAAPATATPAPATPAPAAEPPVPLVVVIPPAEPPPPPPPPRKGSLAPGAALLAIGLASAAGGGVLAYLANRDEKVVEQSGTPQSPVPWADWVATDKEGRTFATTSWVLFGVGGAAAVVGAVLMGIRPGGGPAGDAASPQVWVAPTVGGLVVGGTLP